MTPTPATPPALALPAPIGQVAAVEITAIYPRDGATGSLTFNVLDSSGALLPPASRGAVFVGPIAILPTEADVIAAVTAALSPPSSN